MYKEINELMNIAISKGDKMWLSELKGRAYMATVFNAISEGEYYRLINKANLEIMEIEVKETLEHLNLIK